MILRLILFILFFLFLGSQAEEARVLRFPATNDQQIVGHGSLYCHINDPAFFHFLDRHVSIANFIPYPWASCEKSIQSSMDLGFPNFFEFTRIL